MFTLHQSGLLYIAGGESTPEGSVVIRAAVSASGEHVVVHFVSEGLAAIRTER